MSKLINGKIPANAECPWKNKRNTAIKNKCNHKGLQHNIPFSCGFARGFAICERDTFQPQIMDGVRNADGSITCVDMHRPGTTDPSGSKIVFPEIKITADNSKPRLHR